MKLVIIPDIVALVIACVILKMKRNDICCQQEKSLFKFLTIVLIGVLATDIPAWQLDGCMFQGSVVISSILDTLYYIFQIVYSWLWLVFSDIWNIGDYQGAIYRARWYSIPMMIEIAVILSNPITGWIFTINEQNVYSRGIMYEINLIPYIIYIIAALLLSFISAITTKDIFRRKQSVYLTSSMIFPVCGFIIGVFVYGGSWLWPFVSLSLLMIFVYRQQMDLAEVQHQKDEAQLKMAESEKKAAEARIDIMKSQMQPHFLYNTLASIKILCIRDPEKARDVIDRFSTFLRANTDSLTLKEAIPFGKELEHTKAYTEIEMLRYEGIKVIYDIKSDNFRLPALTLQPMVENAIKHGLYNMNGGEVRITSWADSVNHYITVEDNGEGFDSEGEKDISKKHVGIENTRERLRYMVDGELEIVSTRGVGTCVRIIIPGGEANESSVY